MLSPTDSPQEENSSDSMLAMLGKYFSQLSFQRFKESSSKRIGQTLVVEGLKHTVLGGQPLLLPLSILSSTVAGTVAKWLVQIPAPTHAENGVAQTTSWWDKTKAFVVTLPEEAKTYVMQTTPEDLAKGAVGTLTSAAVSTGFVMIAGPPGVLVLPLYLFLEGTSKSATTFLAQEWIASYLGDKAVIPFSEQVASASSSSSSCSTHHQKSTQEYMEEFESTLDSFSCNEPNLLASQCLNDFLALELSHFEMISDEVTTYSPPVIFSTQQVTLVCQAIHLIEDYFPCKNQKI